jgi:pilus assembly protein CpaC
MGIRQCKPVGGVRSLDNGWLRRCSVAAAFVIFLLSMLHVSPLIAADADFSGLITQYVELPVGHGRLLQLDAPAESVYLADSAVADLRIVAPDVVYVYGRKIGTTNLVAVSAQQKQQVMVQFRVYADARAANLSNRVLEPTTTTRLNLFGNRVAATGQTRSIEEAVDAANVAQTYSPPGQPPINNTTIEGSQQINIRVRFAEVSRTHLESLGIGTSSALGDLGGFAFGGADDIDALVAALQRVGMLTILAEPNLTASSGRSASFLAGGEIPVPVSSGPSGQISVEYKPYGISLQFTPTLIRTNRIGLEIRPEVSALSHAGSVKVNGIELPSLTVRRADTTVEVASGQTFAIAGLFQRQMSQDFDSTPEISDFPVLGALFRSARYRRDETELVILVTPYLVAPVRDRVVATPLDRPAAPPPPPPIVAKAPPSGLVFK